MTTLLRSSTNFARLSSSPIHHTFCEPCQFRFVSQQFRAAKCHSRLFATNPRRCSGGQRRHDAPQKPAATGRSVGKPARGFEDLYQDGSPMSSPNASSKDNTLKSSKHEQEASTGRPAPGFENLYAKDSAMSNESEEGALPPGRTRLGKEEEKMIEEIIDTFRKGLPPSEFRKVEQAFQAFKGIGVPKEFREIMDKLKGGASLDIATAARVIRLTNKLRKEVQAETELKQMLQAQRAKAGKKSSSDNQPKKNADPSPFKFQFSNNIDAGTFLAAIITGYIVYDFLTPGGSSKEITFQEFKTTFLDKGLVNKLTVINAQRVRVDLHREATARMYPESPARHNNFSYYFSIGSVEAFDQNMRDAQDDLGIPGSERIPVQYKSETLWTQALLSFGPTILFVVAIYWLTRRSSGGGSSGGIFGMGRSKAKKFNHDSEVKVRFKDVAGMDEAKQEIMEFVSFLKEPGQYQRLGAKIPRGALLSGPPGTGKTMLAKATAGESGVPFFSISGSEFVEIFVGVGASRVRDLFQTARKSAPCIIFIDEIDAVGKTRSKSTGFGGNDEREGTLNQILTEMDGFNTSEQVVVLAGTNRADVLDKALLRPGRFDRQIAIDRPTMEGRKQIFNVHIKNVITDRGSEFPTGRLAALTPGFSGADIANCVNEAALIAARSQAQTVAMTHFEQAIERVIGGLEKKSLVLNPVEKRTVAYHEAGHAICGWFFKYADPLLKVSIIPRGQGALGYAQYLPPGETYLMTVNQLMDRMAMALGGRVSEEIHFETVTSGASDDFNKVTRMATAMVTKWGMSNKMGYVYFDDSNQESQFQKPFSEHTAMEIDGEVRRIVDEALTQCRDLLREKKKELGLVAEELLSKEVLGRDDLVRILGKRPFEDNAEFSKYFDAPPPPPAPASIPPSPPESGAVAARRLD